METTHTTINQPLLNLAQGAKFLNIGKRTLTTLVAEKRIPHLRVVGRTIRFRVSDLEQYLESRTVRGIGWKKA